MLHADLKSMNGFKSEDTCLQQYDLHDDIILLLSAIQAVQSSPKLDLRCWDNLAGKSAHCQSWWLDFDP